MCFSEAPTFAPSCFSGGRNGWELRIYKSRDEAPSRSAQNRGRKLLTSKCYHSAAKLAMLKWGVGNSLSAFSVHSLRLYFRTCTLSSTFGVPASPCKCGPFENVLVKLCAHACVRAFSCVQQVSWLARRTCGENRERQVGSKSVCTVARFMRSAVEQLHPSLSFFSSFLSSSGAVERPRPSGGILDIWSSISAISDCPVEMFSKGHCTLLGWSLWRTVGEQSSCLAHCLFQTVRTLSIFVLRGFCTQLLMPAV